MMRYILLLNVEPFLFFRDRVQCERFSLERVVGGRALMARKLNNVTMFLGGNWNLDG